MKSLIGLLMILAIAGAALVITKPTDQQCIELMKTKAQEKVTGTAGDNMLSGFVNYFVGKGFNELKSLFRFEDKIFYKEVFIGDVKIGTAVLGSFFITDEFHKKINSLST